MTAHFTVEAAELAGALRKLSGFVSPNSTIHIYGFLFVEAEGDTVTFTATNGDYWGRIQVNAEVKAPGRTTLPAVQLTGLATRLPEGALLTVKAAKPGEKATLTTGTIRPRLDTRDPADFPVLPVLDPAACARFILSAEEWAALFGPCEHAAEVSGARTYLQGVHLVHRKGELRAEASDGHRAAIAWVEPPLGAADLTGVIVPLEGVKLARAMFTEGQAELRISETMMAVITANGTYQGKLIDGSFPAIDRVTPPPHAPAKINVAALRSALERIRVVADTTSKKTHSVAIELQPDSVTLTTANTEGNSYEETIEGDTGRSDPIRLGVSAEYLRDTLRQVTGDEVLFDPQDADSPIRITDSGRDTAVFVLMPLRLPAA